MSKNTKKASKKRKLTNISIGSVLPSTPSVPASTPVFHAHIASSGRLDFRRAVATRPEDDKDDNSNTAGTSSTLEGQDFGENIADEGTDSFADSEIHIGPPKRKRTRQWGNDNGVRNRTVSRCVLLTTGFPVPNAALAASARGISQRARAP